MPYVYDTFVHLKFLGLLTLFGNREIAFDAPVELLLDTFQLNCLFV